MADQPMTTAGTPKAVRDLELKAMALFRAKYPEGIPWQELDDSTRCVWVEHAERQLSAPPQQSPAATPERKEGGNHG